MNRPNPARNILEVGSLVRLEIITQAFRPSLRSFYNDEKVRNLFLIFDPSRLWVALVRKPRTAGGTGGFKWRCSTNCHFFLVIMGPLDVVGKLVLCRCAVSPPDLISPRSHSAPPSIIYKRWGPIGWHKKIDSGISLIPSHKFYRVKRWPRFSIVVTFESLS